MSVSDVVRFWSRRRDTGCSFTTRNEVGPRCDATGLVRRAGNDDHGEDGYTSVPNVCLSPAYTDNAVCVMMSKNVLSQGNDRAANVSLRRCEASLQIRSRFIRRNICHACERKANHGFSTRVCLQLGERSFLPDQRVLGSFG